MAQATAGAKIVDVCISDKQDLLQVVAQAQKQMIDLNPRKIGQILAKKWLFMIVNYFLMPTRSLTFSKSSLASGHF